MRVIDVQNVNEAATVGLPHLCIHGVEEESRHGRVLVAPEPVTTIYRNPKQHVLFSETRDANPFFHLMEALWMLAGRNDVAFPRQFNKRFKDYSDNGLTVWGAYGYRWRKFFGYDQLQEIIHELKTNPMSRRCVLSMWNAMEQEYHTEHDLYKATHGGRDVPCNTHAYFDVRGGVLNMTVCCRSNDAIWGCYGANAVHFAILLEYMAEQIGVPMGVYRQVSNNFHAYLDNYDVPTLLAIAEESLPLKQYPQTIPLYSAHEGWEDDLRLLINEDDAPIWNTPFIGSVAYPMKESWYARKRGDMNEAVAILNTMPECDWKIAALEWTYRRQKDKKDAA